MTTEESKYKQMDDAWAECMLRVGRRITDSFERDTVGFTNILVSTNCTRLLLRWIYHFLIYKKGLKPIEKLDQDDKQKTWEFIKEICAGRVNDRLKMKEIAMAFYTIEYFINEK